MSHIYFYVCRAIFLIKYYINKLLLFKRNVKLDYIVQIILDNSTVKHT